jgi:RimJ/RimL family protein N-acetyltransferase
VHVVSVSDLGEVADALCTDRLLLPPWSDADLDHFALWAQDVEATRHVLLRPLSKGEVKQNHERSLEAWRHLGFGKRSILAADSRRWLGFVEISWVGPGKGCRTDDVEIGYFLLPFAWGQGIATEAVVAARDDAFARAGVLELFGRFRVENAASCRVLEKAGFSFVRSHRSPGGVAVQVTRLTHSDWQALMEGRHPVSLDEGSSNGHSVPTENVWQ